MPPKKGGGGAGPSKQTEQKQKQKTIEDKTFGLKNKNRSAKVNKYVQQVKDQVMSAGNKKQNKLDEERKRLQELKKKEEEEKKKQMLELFQPILQKVPFGVDPKSVLCINFKNNVCNKGDKCKFSHDLEIGRKRNKIDLYTDTRDAEELEREKDTMDQWDQTKLEQVVISKHGGNPKTTTDIVCKFFLEAIDEGKYGWFWECPNGAKTCKYRHALPPGFVLKSRKKEEAPVSISIEDFLETERQKLGSNLTPVTLDTFTQWKRDRVNKAQELAKVERDKKEAAFRAGKSLQVSGRELFDWRPELALEVEDDEAGDAGEVLDVASYERREQGEIFTEEKVVVAEDLFAEEEISDLSDSDSGNGSGDGGDGSGDGGDGSGDGGGKEE